MVALTGPSPGRGAWDLAGRQHGVITHAQLLALGFSPTAIRYRRNRRRIHPLFRGVYAVGRPEVSQFGWWMAAVLACGDGAVLSHLDAAALWRIRRKRSGRIHVSVPRASNRSRPRTVSVHRRSNLLPRERTRQRGIPVTRPATAIVDIAPSLPLKELERTINEADQERVIRFDVLLRELERMPTRPGIGVAKQLVTRHTFRLTRSELERLFLAIVGHTGLPVPLTREVVCGFEVDFWWPQLGLIVEADSLAYHRTPDKQLQDRLRDQAHFAAGLLPLRFTHWQIAKESRYVEERLRQVAARRVHWQPASV